VAALEGLPLGWFLAIVIAMALAIAGAAYLLRSR